MEQNFDPNSQPNLPQTPSKFPTWATILISVVVTALVVGLATYSFVKKDKEIANNNQVTPTPTPTENQTTPTPTPTQTSNDGTENWKTYQNSSLKFTFKYPNQLGQLNDKGENAYILNTFEFSGEAQSVNKISIDTFTDKSVNDWQAAIQNYLNNNEPIGDPATLPYPLSVKNLLTSKAVGYDCTADFGEYLSKQNNESCQIVSINGTKVFKIVATGPFQSEVSELKYLFYVNGTWFDFSKRFWVYSKDDPNKQLYTFEQLNSILQGKTSNATIQAEVDTFNKIISTLKFN